MNSKDEYCREKNIHGNTTVSEVFKKRTNYEVKEKTDKKILEPVFGKYYFFHGSLTVVLLNLFFKGIDTVTRLVELRTR